MLKCFCEKQKECTTVTEADISRIEKKYDIVFPQTLRDFYLKFNGKRIHTMYIPVADEGWDSNEKIDFREIIPLLDNENKMSAFEFIRDNELNDGLISPEFIPLGRECFGDIFYWNKNDGKIYVFSDDDVDENFDLIPRYVCASIDELFMLLNKAFKNGEYDSCG